MDVDLYKFCGKYLDKPFYQDGYSYATDGVIAIRVKVDKPVPPEFLEIEERDCYIKRTVELFGDFKKKKQIKYIPIPEYDRSIKTKECHSCKGIGHHKTCPECDGTGEVHWSTDYNDYEDSCQTCNGGRRLPDTIPCEKCDGKGTVEVDTPIQIGYHTVGAKRLNLIADLPGIEISEDVNSFNAFCFRFNDGEGLLMSLLK